MGSRFDSDLESFAYVSSKTEPSGLRNQIPRNGGRFLFPYSVDSLMMLQTAELLAEKHIEFFGSPSDDLIRESVYNNLQVAMKSDNSSTTNSSSSQYKWGIGTRSILENSDVKSQVKLRSNCGIISSLTSGLIHPSWSSSICSATHSHPSATAGASVISKAIQLGLSEDELLSPTTPGLPATYKQIIEKASSLATSKPFTDDDDFSTDLQQKFSAKFGSDASASCAVAGTVFALHRTLHSLPHLNIHSEEYLANLRQHQSARSHQVRANTLGNSNRMDTEKLLAAMAPTIEQDLPVALAINWAISLGGDSRSVACITGSVAGAIWGEEGIPTEWLLFCQGIDEGRRIADKLYDIYTIS